MTESETSLERFSKVDPARLEAIGKAYVYLH